MENVFKVVLKNVRVPKYDINIGELSMDISHKSSAEEIKASCDCIITIADKMVEYYKYDVEQMKKKSE